MTLLFDKLAGCIPACQITAKMEPPRRIVLVGVASTASITINGLERPMKKQHVSSLIPGDYKPLAKCVPGIAGGRERILGRDVLNRIDVLFRGPAGEIVVNP